MTSMDRSSAAHRFAALAVACVFVLTSCASSIVTIRPPYPEKLLEGDGVKITGKDGTLYAGRVIYVDRKVVVLRTPKQTISENPVKTARFATTIPWSEVTKVRVAGVLDRKGRLISNEEIRIKRRTKDWRNYAINIGLLGLVGSFVLGVAIQDAVSPNNTDLSSTLR